MRKFIVGHSHDEAYFLEHCPLPVPPLGSPTAECEVTKLKQGFTFLFLLLYERISEVKINKLQSYANAICN
jgi:predicted cation transporter